MKKIVKFWNENRFMIIIVVIIIVFVFALIYVTNSIFKQMSIKQSQQGYNENNINKVREPIQSLVTGQEITVEQTNKLDTLDEFIKLCNEDNVEGAYALLSEECKELLYPTIDDFKNNYYNKLFNGDKKNVNIENWVGDTYRVEVADDFLSTGVYNESNIIQDYITIVKNDAGENKLNINRYIEKDELSKTASNNNIEITAIDTDIYMDCQVINFGIKNNSDKQILLDDNLVEDSLYIQDGNDIKYSAYMHELAEAELIILPNQTKELSITFYSNFDSTRNIARVEFSRIVTNYATGEPANYTNIRIEL